MHMVPVYIYFTFYSIFMVKIIKFSKFISSYIGIQNMHSWFLQTGQHQWTDEDQLCPLNWKLCWEISGGPNSGWNGFDTP